MNEVSEISEEIANETKKVYKIIKWVIISIIAFITVNISTVITVRNFGKKVNNRIPFGGINKSMYVKINNSRQWINIYGDSVKNPVILYLHGGPGSPTSYIDYKFLRKWSDVFTVVSWDQRDVGLSSNFNQLLEDIPYTKELLMDDGIEMTKYLLNYLKKDKLILIGHSWGSIFGANLVLEHPEYYEYFIGTGQVVDIKENEKALKEAVKEWTRGDKEGEQLYEKFISTNSTREYVTTRYKLMKRYGYDGLAEKPDYSMLGALFFNPYYSYYDIFRLLANFVVLPEEQIKYLDFLFSPEFDKFSLLNRTEYQIPFYNINGDHDYQANTFQAEDYFNDVKAPRKKLYMMKDMNHGLLEVRSNEFSDIIHEIAKTEQDNKHMENIVNKEFFIIQQ